MYFGYDIPNYPADGVYISAITAGVTLSNYQNVLKFNPKLLATFNWPTGVETISKNVTLQYQCNPKSMRIGCMLNTSLPVGIKVTITGFDEDFNPVDLGGNSTTARVAMYGDGTNAVKWRFADGLPELGIFQIRIYNDVNGSVGPLSTGQSITFGFTTVIPAVYFAHEKNAKKAPACGLVPVRMLGGSFKQLNRYVGSKLTFKPQLMTDAETRGGGLQNGMDFEQLLYKLQRAPWALLIPEDDTEAHIQRTGFFGVCTNAPAIESMSGPTFQGEPFEFEEIPNI